MGSFSIGFADVGADIYVALGLVLFFATGAAPLALAVAALGYMFTALAMPSSRPPYPRPAALRSSPARRSTISGDSSPAGGCCWTIRSTSRSSAGSRWATWAAFCQNLAPDRRAVGRRAGRLNSLNTVAMGTPELNYSYQAIATIFLCRYA